MTNSRYSVYRMENNSYLGDCLSIVYKASKDEISLNGLTGSDVAIYIKTPKDISDINSIDQLKNADLFQQDRSAILRIASECQFGIFGDSHCDCESQRIACLDAMKNYGQGIYVQLPQEGQGHGLHYKAKELQLQVHGTDPSGRFVGKKDIYEASRILSGSTEVDNRNFAVLKCIFHTLRLDRFSYTLISSNPQKILTLSNEVGVNIIGAQDVKRELNLDNVGEYLAKIYKKSFALSDEYMRKIYEILFSADEIPGRVLSLLKYIHDDLKLGREFSVNEVLLEKITSLAKSSDKCSQSVIGVLDTSLENRYREFQLELTVNNKDISKLIRSSIIDGLSDFAFEQNYFYDLVYFKNTVARDLKIRRKSKVGSKREILESRLIYKSPIGENEYEIKNIAINDREVADLLSNSLEGYEIFYVPVFVHTCEHSSYYPDLLILLKRYSKNLRTLSIMGDKSKVSKLINKMSEIIKIEVIPDPTNIRSINKDLSLDFDYDDLANQELILFDKYKCKE